MKTRSGHILDKLFEFTGVGSMGTLEAPIGVKPTDRISPRKKVKKIARNSGYTSAVKGAKRGVK